MLKISIDENHYQLRPVAEGKISIEVFIAAVKVLAAIVLLVAILPAQEKLNAARPLSAFNIQAETACETEMLHTMGAQEVFSGKGYEVLAEVGQAYGGRVRTS